MTRWLWLAALVALHAGCTTLTAGQRAHLDDWQRFADRVTAHYGVSDVTFLVGEQPGAGGGAIRPGGLMTFRTQMLEPLPAGQSRDFLLAHELAHRVLGHAYRRPPDEAATSLWEAQQERRELDANAEAVKILMIGRHWSERRAFFHAHAYLWSYRRGVEARRYGIPAGHPVDPCVEINDLIRRYPAYRDISDSCPSWPEPRWAEHAAQRDALSSALPPDVR
jgi:hypothetical protein